MKYGESKVQVSRFKTPSRAVSRFALWFLLSVISKLQFNALHIRYKKLEVRNRFGLYEKLFRQYRI